MAKLAEEAYRHGHKRRRRADKGPEREEAEAILYAHADRSGRQQGRSPGGSGGL